MSPLDHSQQIPHRRERQRDDRRRRRRWWWPRGHQMAGNARGVHSRARLTYKRRSLLLFFPSPVAPLPYLYRPARRRTDAVKSQGRRDCHTTHDRQSAPNWRHAIANELRIGTECSRESLRKKTALRAALRLTSL